MENNIFLPDPNLTELELIENFGNEEEQLYEHFKLKIDSGQSPLRIDKFLANKLNANVTRTKIQNALKANCVHVNGNPVKASYKVKPHEEITILLTRPPVEYVIIPEKMDLQILYEDTELLVLYKPAGLVVHPGHGNYAGTLVHGLTYHFQNLPNYQNTLNDLPRPGLVHRLDKNTSGVMVVAKTDFAMQHLAKQFFDHTINRRYVALVWGDMPQNEGTITGYLARSKQNRQLMDVYDNESEGKWAVTHYKVLQRFGYVTLVECKLETGRTHQIRVHFKHIGHPVFGDMEYGGNRIVKGTIFDKYRQFVENCFQILPRQALHARLLGLEHPTLNQYLQFETLPPADFEAVLKKWETYTSALKR